MTRPASYFISASATKLPLQKLGIKVFAGFSSSFRGKTQKTGYCMSRDHHHHNHNYYISPHNYSIRVFYLNSGLIQPNS